MEQMNDYEIRIAEAVKRGATMEEMAQLHEPACASPEQAIRALRDGNGRFFNGNSALPVLSPMERRAQVVSQTPFAVVLGCSDSRVPVEIVFDQGAGSLFIVRLAGNVVGLSGQGSIEYAVKHLKVHAVVVMGHEGCGAVAASMLDDEARAREPENVQKILERVRPAVADLPRIRDPKARMREAVIANVRLQVHELNKNPVVSEATARKQIAVIGAYYEITSGAVDFFVTQEELRL
ncbi:MAG: carbonic anhydrase [Armatimonadetes bacterium]|nr:carbonic anhydrase [Armatimonadota bacterium]